ncbi:uroporphyrinogen-III synthase [Geobacter sp. OR-1]|nr:uroporphyrinogen-III synthase [Geobacter sp. OR-1]
MGVKNLQQITEKMIDHGRAPDTPVALVRWGTRPEQEVLTGTLEEIAAKAKKAGFKAPAITIVGEVVRMREKLRWFDTRPLFGKGILVTRAADQAGEFSAMLEELGATVWECPTIQIVDPESTDAIDKAITELSSFSWIIFTSINTVQHVFARLNALGLDSRAFGSGKVCAVGPKTAAAIAKHGITPDMVPPNYKAEGVIEAFRSMELSGKRILYPKADRARDLIPKAMAEMGAEVVDPVAYRNILPEAVPPPILQALEERKIHCVTFTSSSTVDNLAKLLGENRFLHLLDGVAVAAIGPITGRTCRDLGLKVTIEPTQYTIASMKDEIVRYFNSLHSKEEK